MIAKNIHSDDYLKLACLNRLSKVIDKIKKETSITEVRSEYDEFLNQVTLFATHRSQIGILARTRNLGSMLKSNQIFSDEKDRIMSELSQIRMSLEGVTVSRSPSADYPTKKKMPQSVDFRQTPVQKQLQSYLKKKKQFIDLIQSMANENNAVFEAIKTLRVQHQKVAADSKKALESVSHLQNKVIRTQIHFNQIHMEMDFLEEEKKRILAVINDQQQGLDKMLKQLGLIREDRAYSRTVTEDSKELALHMTVEMKSSLNQTIKFEEKIQSSEKALKKVFDDFNTIIIELEES